MKLWNINHGQLLNSISRLSPQCVLVVQRHTTPRHMAYNFFIHSTGNTDNLKEYMGAIFDLVLFTSLLHCVYGEKYTFIFGRCEYLLLLQKMEENQYNNVSVGACKCQKDNDRHIIYTCQEVRTL